MSLSPRLLRVVDALPIAAGTRVLEIGGAPGAAAREVAARVGPNGHVLVLDRSTNGVARTRSACADLIDAGLLSTLCADVEGLVLPAGTASFDVAFACRVGALDGRHPHLQDAAIERVARALTPDGRLFVDTGSPLREITLPRPGRR